MSMQALTAERVFDGEQLHSARAVLVDGDRVAAVVGRDNLPSDVQLNDLGSGILAPGFVDVQVNGGGGVLFNDTPTLDGIRRIAAAHRRFGTTALLPTVITDATAVMQQAVAAAREACAAGVPGVLGIHVEGPFLDPTRRGAHPPQHVRPLAEADFDWLDPAGLGVLLLTLSPASVAPAIVRALAQGGIVLSLGHSDATAAEANAARAAGARGFTHLFNAMSQLGHRSPGMVGAALADEGSYCGVIADGHHVDPLALRVAFAAKGAGRLFLVSDAMPTAAGGPDTFFLQGRRVERQGGRLTLADGTLAGSDLTMDAAVRTCVDRLGIGIASALRMATLTPAEFLGQDRDHGRLAPGCRADMVHLSDELGVRATYVGGIKVEG